MTVSLWQFTKDEPVIFEFEERYWFDILSNLTTLCQQKTVGGINYIDRNPIDIIKKSERHKSNNLTYASQ